MSFCRNLSPSYFIVLPPSVIFFLFVFHCLSFYYNTLRYTGRTLHKQYGEGTDLRIWMDGVQCSGSEQSLDACRHRGWGVHDCFHNQDVSIACSPQESTSANRGLQTCLRTFYQVTNCRVQTGTVDAVASFVCSLKARVRPSYHTNE